MNSKLNKKLNPYLYPFKMKLNNILYPRNPVTQFLKTGNTFQTLTDKDWFLKMRLINLPTEFMGITNPDIPLVTKIMDIPSMDMTNNRLKSTSTFCKSTKLASNQYKDISKTFEESIPSNQYEDISKTFEESKPSKASLARPKSVTLIGSNPINVNLPCVGPKLRYMTFASSNCTDINLGRPVPEDVSWTRIDRTQEKLDRISVRLKVVMGVLAGIIATTTVHPLDVIKVRLQLFPKKISTLTMLRRIMVCEGRRGLYAGLSAGILRQLTYTGSRLFVYNTLCDIYKKEHGKYPDFSSRLHIAIVAGLVGAFMGTPSELALVRMIEVWRLRRSRCSPPCSIACKKFPHPEGVILKLWRIARREGVRTWWRGCVPTLIRSIFISSAHVGLYSEIRQAFTSGEHIETGIKLHLYIAMFSSLVSAFVSLPVDSVKTRFQSYQERHRRYMDILNDILRKKGARYLWKGFLPYFLRQVIHTVITYVVLDVLVDNYVEFQESSHPKHPKR